MYFLVHLSCLITTASMSGNRLAPWHENRTTRPSPRLPVVPPPPPPPTAMPPPAPPRSHWSTASHARPVSSPYGVAASVVPKTSNIWKSIDVYDSSRTGQTTTSLRRSRKQHTELGKAELEEQNSLRKVQKTMREDARWMREFVDAYPDPDELSVAVAPSSASGSDEAVVKHELDTDEAGDIAVKHEDNSDDDAFDIKVQAALQEYYDGTDEANIRPMDFDVLAGLLESLPDYQADNAAASSSSSTTASTAVKDEIAPTVTTEPVSLNARARLRAAARR